ncbi:MAG: hypothetical protein K5773_09070 [Pseudobutyrivibrio sp.]|nr:hypothetical protein [Pseudobutyrivibrio sp.]
MINWMKRLNPALPGLVLGILIYGLLVEAVGVWFVSEKFLYTTGLFIGIACAIFMAIHISMIIEESIRIGKGHEKWLSFKSVMRYLIVCAVMVLMTWLKLGNMFTALIGIFGLKVSAYAQPLLYKFFKTDNGEEITNDN